MTDIVARIREQTQQFQAQRKLLVEELKTNFHGMFTDVFEKYPEVKRFSWIQYTPYFADGDTCEFSRHEINAFTEEDTDSSYWEDDESILPSTDTVRAYGYFLQNGKFPDDFQRWMTEDRCKMYDNQTREEYCLSQIPEEITKLRGEELEAAVTRATEISNFIDTLESIPEDIFEELFGDHAFVKVTRSGVETDEYDHD